jgi:hypothetical protein
MGNEELHSIKSGCMTCGKEMLITIRVVVPEGFTLRKLLKMKMFKVVSAYCPEHIPEV